MTEEETVLTNQTQFSYEEPYRQSAKERFTTEKSELVQKSRPRPIMYIAVGLVVTVVLLLLLVLLKRKPVVIENAPFQQAITATPVPAEFNPLLERVSRLEIELEEADPIKQSLLFPPVDMDIRLDPKKR